MSFIHWDPETTLLKKYSSNTTSGPRGKTVIRIEIETSDSYALASLLESLGGIEQDQRKAREKAKATAKNGRGFLALPAPQLKLTDSRDPFDA